MTAIRLGDVTETIHTQAPNQQTAGNYKSGTETKQDEDDKQCVHSARTVTRFGRLAGSWFNLIDPDTGSD